MSVFLFDIGVHFGLLKPVCKWLLSNPCPFTMIKWTMGICVDSSRHKSPLKILT